MKRALTLLAITMLTANSVGCCCCRGLRDWFYQGAYCGSTAPATYAVAPGPAYAAPPQYVAAPQYAMPQQYAVAPQAQMMYGEPSCCSSAYVPETSCCAPTAYAEPACSYADGAEMSTMGAPTYITPSPAAE